MNDITGEDHRKAATRMTRALSTYMNNYDKISMGLYDPPTEEEADLAERGARVREFLEQDRFEAPVFDETLAALQDWVS